MAKDEDESNGKKRPLTRSEKFRNYCIGIAALTGLILGTFNILKGEPTAQKAWDTSQEAINKNRESINKLGDGLRRLHLMFVHMQGQQEGYNNAKMMQEIEGLKKDNEALRKKSASSQGASGERLVEAPNDKDCHPGWVRVGGKCTKNRATIAKAVKNAREEVKRAKEKLLLERRLRKAAERANVQMQQIPLPPPKPMPKLSPVPRELDKASKYGK